MSVCLQLCVFVCLQVGVCVFVWAREGLQVCVAV